MARTAVLTLLFCAFAAPPANAAFISQQKNLDWPPTTDFQLTSDPCAQSQCSFTARMTFRYKGKVVGRLPLHSPAREGGDWDAKRFGHVETTNYAQFFWICDTPGKYTWSAKITQTQDGQETEHPAESGQWSQPGCSKTTPRRVTNRRAVATVTKKIIFGDRTLESARCKKKEKVGRWECVVRWSNEARTCTDTQSLFFYTRKFFHRRFNRVSSFRDARSCTPNS